MLEFEFLYNFFLRSFKLFFIKFMVEIKFLFLVLVEFKLVCWNLDIICVVLGGRRVVLELEILNEFFFSIEYEGGVVLIFFIVVRLMEVIIGIYLLFSLRFLFDVVDEGIVVVLKVFVVLVVLMLILFSVWFCFLIKFID